METKKCKRCGIEKDVSEFSKNSKMNGGYINFCKKCMYSKYKENLNKKRVSKENIQYDENVVHKCFDCGKILPHTPDFFYLKGKLKGNLSKLCKECDNERIDKERRGIVEKRKKCIDCGKEFENTFENFYQQRSCLDNRCRSCRDTYKRLQREDAIEKDKKLRRDGKGNIQCKKCKEYYTESEEYFNRKNNFGLEDYCKKCKYGWYEWPKNNKKQVCKKCGNAYDLNENYFYKSNSCFLGYRKVCKKCINNWDFWPDNNIAKDGHKFCIKCHKELPSTEKYFKKEIRNSDNLQNTCVDCLKLAHNKKVNSLVKINDYFVKEIKIYEETRIDPNNKKLLQFRCKTCNNWFNPKYKQIINRINIINYTFSDGSYLYCSNKCKNSCSVFRKQLYRKNENKNYIKRDVPEWLIEQVKENANYKCEICESNNDLQVHHIQPYSLHPQLGSDLSELICLCKNCHDKYGHGDDNCKSYNIRCESGKVNFDKLEN